MALPKRQPYPSSRIKPGAVLYSAYSHVHNGKVETGFNEWVVRNIRARRNSLSVGGITLASRGIEVPKVVNLAMKTCGTWGKRSTKTGDVGWLPKIGREFLRQFRVGTDLPVGIYTTKRAALAYELASQLDFAKWNAEEIVAETDPDELLILNADQVDTMAQIAALQRRTRVLAKAASI